MSHWHLEHVIQCHFGLVGSFLHRSIHWWSHLLLVSAVALLNLVPRMLCVSTPIASVLGCSWPLRSCFPRERVCLLGLQSSFAYSYVAHWCSASPTALLHSCRGLHIWTWATVTNFLYTHVKLGECLKTEEVPTRVLCHRRTNWIGCVLCVLVPEIIYLKPCVLTVKHCPPSAADEWQYLAIFWVLTAMLSKIRVVYWLVKLSTFRNIVMP
jgi:hypothetical protein